MWRGSCLECGTKYERKRSAAEFCGDKCRMAFNQRRRDRGTELYDILMSARFDAKDRAAPGDLVAKLLSAYKAADDHARNGRASWQRWSQAQTRIPNAYSKEGDKR